MAGKKDGSMLQELYSAINPYEYSDYINLIIPRDSMSLSEFQNSLLRDRYWVDTHHCLDKDGVKEDMLFKLFGNFSDDNSITVRANMISEVKNHLEWYECAAFILNIMKQSSMETWLNIMKYEGIKGDEISIHALSRIYKRHVVVYTKSRPWTTVKLSDDITENMLSDICDIQLLYMGNSVFAELKQKPYSVTPARAFATDPLAQISAMKRSANPAIPVPLNLSGKQTPSTPSCATESTPSTENTTKSANITSHLSEPDTNSTNKAADTGMVPTYGTPVFPTAIQILPLHPHFSDDDTDTMEDQTTDESVNTSKTGDTVVENSDNTPVTKAPPDVINRECKVQLIRLTEDEISIWFKKDALPKFPEFVETVDIGGYSMRKRSDASTTRHNQRPRRTMATEITYDGMDADQDTESPKPKRQKNKVCTTVWPICIQNGSS